MRPQKKKKQQIITCSVVYTKLLHNLGYQQSPFHMKGVDQNLELVWILTAATPGMVTFRFFLKNTTEPLTSSKPNIIPCIVI